VLHSYPRREVTVKVYQHDAEALGLLLVALALATLPIPIPLLLWFLIPVTWWTIRQEWRGYN